MTWWRAVTAWTTVVRKQIRVGKKVEVIEISVAAKTANRIAQAAGHEARIRAVEIAQGSSGWCVAPGRV